MKYLNKTFTVNYGSKEYRDNWSKIFDKQDLDCDSCDKDLSMLPCPCESCPILINQIKEEIEDNNAE